MNCESTKKMVHLQQQHPIDMIKFNDIHLTFANSSVFDRLSFTIESGYSTCISGPSGSGKSTLLKLVQGYILPDKGEILVDGIPITEQSIPTIRSKMAYVPQNIHLPVASGSELRTLLDVKIDQVLLTKIITSLGMDIEMMKRPFDEMSGGQKQRIIIALCLSLGREIVLLDEPTAALDEQSIGQLISVINNLTNTTVLSASHNSEWINAMDKVIQL
jgi:putative ABC transport system ATP-binding protein